MSDPLKSLTAGEVTRGATYVEAHRIVAGQHPDTTTVAAPVRTVVTTMTTGNLSLRYAPRPAVPLACPTTTS